jgi:hypothetical protein
MAQPTSPLLSISATPLACLIARTVYNNLLDIRSLPPHPEPTVLDFMVSVRGLTAWVLAQHDLREHHPQQTHDNVEAFLWEQEVQRNEWVLTTRSLLDKGSKAWLNAHYRKEKKRTSKGIDKGGRWGGFTSPNVNFTAAEGR